MLLNPKLEYIFVAGDSGIASILEMMRQLKSQGSAPFKLIYCTQDAASTAFAEELASAEWAGHVTLHHDHGDSNNAFDFWPLFENPTQAQVYCHGSRELADAVTDMTGHWPSGAIHFEGEAVDSQAQTKQFAANTAFTVRLQKSGATLPVSADESILQALRAGGYSVASSCESGTCGTCRTPLLAGLADHRDIVLSDADKTSHIMVCVSRAISNELVLDL